MITVVSFFFFSRRRRNTRCALVTGVQTCALPICKYTYAVQGLGHVGMEYVKLLKERGAKIFVTDINKTLVDKAVNEYGAEAVGTDEIYDVAADVYSPCALGGTLNEQTLPRFKFKIGRAHV